MGNYASKGLKIMGITGGAGAGIATGVVYAIVPGLIVGGAIGLGIGYFIPRTEKDHHKT